MIGSAELSGIMAMMPAFTTDNGTSLDATDTIDLDRLDRGLNRMIEDGAGLIATCGSFGEFHTLLWEEFQTINRAAVEIADKRLPVFVGATALNTREALLRMQFASEIGADGVLVGVPFYFPSTVDNAVRFYRDVAERFPDLGIMIYHNPTLHHVMLPVPAFAELVKIPNIVAMKDSHRDTMQFLKLQEVVRGHISVFCFQLQFHPYYELGAAGFWSIDAWMGPGPLLAYHQAVVAGDSQRAKEIMFRISPVLGGAPPSLLWRETGAKMAIRYAGYCDPGPLRPPFSEIPDDIDRAAKTKANNWQKLCAELEGGP